MSVVFFMSSFFLGYDSGLNDVVCCCYLARRQQEWQLYPLEYCQRHCQLSVDLLQLGLLVDDYTKRISLHIQSNIPQGLQQYSKVGLQPLTSPSKCQKSLGQQQVDKSKTNSFIDEHERITQ